MKTIFINILIFTTIFVSCVRDETTTTTRNELLGEWSLVEYSKGFGGNESFAINDIIWKFNSDNTINVTLNVTPNLEIPLGATGVYDYTLDGNQITLPDGSTFEFILLSGGTILRLSQNGASDGDIISFEKL
jgi:hypothetical protein